MSAAGGIAGAAPVQVAQALPLLASHRPPRPPRVEDGHHVAQRLLPLRLQRHTPPRARASGSRQDNPCSRPFAKAPACAACGDGAPPREPPHERLRRDPPAHHLHLACRSHARRSAPPLAPGREPTRGWAEGPEQPRLAPPSARHQCVTPHGHAPRVRRGLARPRRARGPRPRAPRSRWYPGRGCALRGLRARTGVHLEVPFVAARSERLLLHE
mmetsp:Transcript_1208/g.3364  ORF Transcript_1208/g.3364 Transcript_1208/m.3364 type:complete len:214 (-) Transcript_1208:714-1355(-)